MGTNVKMREKLTFLYLPREWGNGRTPRLATLVEHPTIRGVCLSTLGDGYTQEGGDGNW